MLIYVVDRCNVATYPDCGTEIAYFPTEHSQSAILVLAEIACIMEHM